VGAVEHPGVQTVREDGSNNNIVSIVGNAGGYLSHSDRKNIVVENKGQKQVLALSDDQRAKYNVQNNDYIYIPYRNDQVVLLGEVKYPGIRQYNPNWTLSDYLAIAGGLMNSSTKEVFVINDYAQTSINVKVKLTDQLMIESKTGEVEIKPGTMIYAPKNFIASWREVFADLILLRDTINYPRTFNDATSYYINNSNSGN